MSEQLHMGAEDLPVRYQVEQTIREAALEVKRLITGEALTLESYWLPDVRLTGGTGDNMGNYVVREGLLISVEREPLGVVGINDLRPNPDLGGDYVLVMKPSTVLIGHRFTSRGGRYLLSNPSLRQLQDVEWLRFGRTIADSIETFKKLSDSARETAKQH